MAKKKKRMEYRYYEIPADTYVLPLLGKGWEQEYGVGIRDMLHFIIIWRSAIAIMGTGN